MNRTIIYIVLLAVLGFGVYYFVFRDRDMFASDEAGFTVKDTGDIGRIYMADKSGQSVTLERTADGWTVNKKYLAIPGTVNGFLTVLTQQSAQYPVPKKMHNTAVTGLAANGVKVELYDRENKKIKVFYVGGQVNTEGTFMLIEGARQPYVVQIPGFEGYLTPRYNTELQYWRDRTVFNVPADNIQQIKVDYPSEPLNSFVLVKDANGKVSMTADTALTKGKQLNGRRAEAYATFFTDIYAEGFLNGTIGIDSTIAHVPKRAAIDVTDTKGKARHIDIYWMPVNKRSKNMLTPDPSVPAEFDADRAYGVMNNYKDTVIIQYATFDKLFRKAWEFWETDKVLKTSTDSMHK